DLDVGHPFGHRLRGLLLLELLDLELRTLALDLLLVAVGGQQGQLPRQQVVACVAVGDLHQVAAAPEVVDVLSEYHFHGCPQRSNAQRAKRAKNRFSLRPSRALRSTFVNRSRTESTRSGARA